MEGIDFGCDDGMKSWCYSISPSQTGPLSQQFLNDLGAVPYYTYRNGSVGWNEMVAFNEDDKAVEKLPNLRQQLTDLGYDLIFLDFSDGATYIQSNAMTLVELLQYLNDPAHRTSDAQETIVTPLAWAGR